MVKTKLEKAYDRGFRGVYFKKDIPRWIVQDRKLVDAYWEGMHAGVKKDVANEDFSSFGYLANVPAGPPSAQDLS